MILAISGKRMAEQQVLVKDLHGLETLGSITLLATDKTGTLTRYNKYNLEIL
jgi:sodium/potassium-transporting ATPase subunit alpha